jgi:hypothetical protein
VPGDLYCFINPQVSHSRLMVLTSSILLIFNCVANEASWVDRPFSSGTRTVEIFSGGVWGNLCRCSIVTTIPCGSCHCHVQIILQTWCPYLGSSVGCSVACLSFGLRHICAIILTIHTFGSPRNNSVDSIASMIPYRRPLSLVWWMWQKFEVSDRYIIRSLMILWNIGSLSVHKS